MYRPVHFREDRPEVLARMLEAHPLGLLIRAHEGMPVADPVPFLLDGEAAAGGRLIAHVARANPLVREAGDGRPVLVVFQGPQAYVSPSWYPSKAEHGRVVPTWNYVVVQARGVLRLVDDPAFKRSVVEKLTLRHETGRPDPWSVDDAPPEFVEAQLRAVVGVEIAISAIEGKWKTSGNRAAADRAGVAAGLAERGDAAMAALVSAAGDGEAEEIG
mgnify:CR=1 FL=1